jgi:hypothetical protein
LSPIAHPWNHGRPRILRTVVFRLLTADTGRDEEIDIIRRDGCVK